MAYTQRYLAYCAANGVTDPEQMLIVDRRRWPGGAMCGYILWVSANRLAFRAANKLIGDLHEYDFCARHPGAFDAWLTSAAAVRPERGVEAPPPMPACRRQFPETPGRALLRAGGRLPPPKLTGPLLTMVEGKRPTEPHEGGF